MSLTDRNLFLKHVESGEISKAVEMANLSGEKEIYLAALGDHFCQIRNFDLARSFYSESLAVKPNAPAEFGMGSVLLSEGRVVESLAFFAKSHRNESYAVSSLLKMGMAQRLLGNIKASLASYLSAKKMGYDKFILDVNIAVLLSDLGESELAEKYYENAMRKAPDDSKARFNYSLHLLSSGDLVSGFKYYESRPWCFRGFGEEWAGDCGKDVLVISEQGYGDLIQFSRFIPEVKKISGKVALACDPVVSKLVAREADEVFGLDADSLKAAGERYPFYCRIMSIPHLMSLDPTSFGSFRLKPDSERVEFWKGVLGKDKSIKVGLCWQGGKRNDSEMIFNDRKRSIDLKILEPILNVEGAKFYSLQKNWTEPHAKIIDVMGMSADFSDTASLIECLDLVVSVDTAVAHVAGSIGKPVWMLSRVGGCWRWGRSGTKTFWYPSMKIFRQKTIDQWSDVVDEVKNDLANFVRCDKIS